MVAKKGGRARKKVMAKLCPRGKAAAKRKFKVYPSAYANMYASAVCSGKVTPGAKEKEKFHCKKLVVRFMSVSKICRQLST